MNSFGIGWSYILNKTDLDSLLWQMKRFRASWNFDEFLPVPPCSDDSVVLG
jgi:hypothetical protein